ncbi:MAG: hypothetical protein KAJ07_02545, partial [Planctomycetes bacterium]|nr:hypothetical protein [Planctomycetota bacterium]
MSYSLDGIYNNTVWAIDSHTAALSKLQEQAATGQLISRASESPQDSHRLLGLYSDMRSMDGHLDTIGKVVASFETASIGTQNITGTFTDAQTNFMNGLAVSLPSSLAGVIDGYLETIVLNANIDHAGVKMFGGDRSDVNPYVVTRDGQGRITQVTYQGSQSERTVEVATGVDSAATFVGDNMFKFDDRQSPEFMSDDGAGNTKTGLVVGAGTQTVRGDVTLTVTDNGGGNFDLSIDDGASSVAVTAASGDVAVTHSVTGEVFYVNTASISSGGTEYIRVPGTYDIFNSLMNARDMLLNKDSMTNNEWNTMYNDMNVTLGEVQESVTRTFPTIGGRTQTLSSLEDSLREIKFNTESEISQVQDADIAHVAVDLAKYQVLY